jgi:hypothetical protein
MILAALAFSGFFGTIPLTPEPLADVEIAKAAQEYVKKVTMHIRALLVQNWEKHQSLKEQLLAHGSLPGHEVTALLEGDDDAS